MVCLLLFKDAEFYGYHRVTFYANRAERGTQLLQQPDVITTSIEEVSSSAKPVVRQLRKFPKRIKKLIEMLPYQEACCHIFIIFSRILLSGVFCAFLSDFLSNFFQVNEEEASLFDMLWLLLASVVFVPIFQKIPGGS